jgi:hypothetical protein
VEAGCGGREVEDAGKTDLKTSPNRARGRAAPVSQNESCEVERSPGSEGPDAPSERSETEHRSRSVRASKRNAAAFRLSDRLESGRHECGGFAEQATGKGGERSRSKSRRSLDAGNSLTPRINFPVDFYLSFAIICYHE